MSTPGNGEGHRRTKKGKKKKEKKKEKKGRKRKLTFTRSDNKRPHYEIFRALTCHAGFVLYIHPYIYRICQYITRRRKLLNGGCISNRNGK